MQVVAAIIFYNNKVVVTQRQLSKDPNFSFKYEFPGGKVEKKEALLNALKRELREELDIDVNIDCIHEFENNESNHTIENDGRQINLTLFRCSLGSIPGIFFIEVPIKCPI